MVAVAPLPELFALASDQGEQRIVMSDVSWDEYVTLRKLLDGHPGLRLTYREGVLELMSPSAAHEDVKKRIGRLIEAWALSRRVRLYAFGSTTYRSEARRRGLEPDECYCVGQVNKARPDIAVEVFITRGGIDKLDVYRGLDVPEVWIWKDGRLAVHRLGEGGYGEAERSAILPDLDLGALSECARIPDQADAVEAYWERLKRGG